MTFRTRMKLAVVGVAGALALLTGLAFAGALPDAAQDAAKDAFASFGITIPAGDQAGTQNHDEDAPDGEEVSDTARDVDGLEDAGDLADEVSGGHSVTGTSTAEENAVTGTSTADENTSGTPPANTTDDTPTDEQSGRETGDDASSGASGSGAGNAEDRP